MRRFGYWTTALLLSVNLAACAADDDASEAIDGEDPIADDGKYEAWNQANNPAFVDSTFVYEVEQLPLDGRAKNAPWSGDYWATARDSIAARRTWNAQPMASSPGTLGVVAIGR